MKRTIGAALLSAGIAALAAPASAQSVYLGVFGGTSAQTPSYRSLQFTTDTEFVYGVRAGLNILMLGVEVMYFQAAHNIGVSALPGDLIKAWNGKVNDYSYLGANAKLFFPFLIVHPYVTVGYGYYTANIETIDKGQDGGFNFGAGVELKLGSKFGITAEGRWHHVTVDIQSIALGLGDFTLTGGLNFYF